MEGDGELRDFSEDRSDNSLDSVREQEENPDDSFISTVSNKKSQDQVKPSSARSAFKFFFKKSPAFAPLVGIALFAIAGIFLAFLANSMMPFAVVTRMVEEFNTVGISSTIRTDNLLDLQLSMTGDPLGLTDYQRSALKDQGLIVAEYSGTYALAYRRPSGKYAVVATTQIVENNDTGVLSAVSELFPEGKKPTFDTEDALITPVLAMNDSAFATPFTTASKLWRGGIAGWYDSVADLSSTVHGYSRSRWAVYVANGTSNIINEFATIAASAIKSASSSASGSSVALTGPNGETLKVDGAGNLLRDEAGNYISAADDSAISPSSTIQTSVDGTSVTAGALSAAQITAKFSAAAKTATNAACAGVEGLISVQTLLSTYNRINKINAASSFIEATQLAQYNQITGGPSAGADPMLEHLDRLTTVDSKTGKSAMQSEGMGALMSGDSVDPTNSSVLNQNSEKLVATISEDSEFLTGAVAEIMNGGTNLVRAMTVCNYTKAGLSLVSATASAVATALTFGGSQVVTMTFGAVVKGIIKQSVLTAIGIIAPIVATKIISKIGENFMKDAATEWFGTDLGDALVSGANSTISANSQTGGASPGSSAKVATYKSAQTTVLAKEAEYERATRSPLDPSSRYTFLGSLAYSAIPFASAPTVSLALKSLGTLAQHSLVALLPSASAVAETSMIGLAQPGDCPVLEQAGIQGDIYCNPLIIEDSSTLSSALTPQEVFDWELAQGNIKQSGDSYVINEDKKANPLVRYAKYCSQRVSNWGIPDANIASSLESESSSTLKTVLSFIPIISDLTSLVDAATNQTNLPWTSGSACVASDSNPYWDGASGNNKIHQAFMSSDRWLENTGLTSESVVASYMQEYYAKNPLDNSFEGILARYSGMTKEDVIATLDLMEGLTLLAKYHPAERKTVDKMQKLFTPVKDLIQNQKPTLASLGTKIKQFSPLYQINPDTKLEKLIINGIAYA